MSWFYNLLAIAGIRKARADGARRESSLAPTVPSDLGRTPILASTDWQAIKEYMQAEVRALVPKTIVESIYNAQTSVTPEDQNVLLQGAANRLYADVSYEILSTGVAPPFEPAEEILRWAQDALDESLVDWQRKDRGVEAGEYEPPIADEQLTTKAILDALRRASAYEVLQEAAIKRLEMKAAMVADDLAETPTLSPTLS